MKKNIENSETQINSRKRFIFSYYQLNYKQKFIRTIMATPFLIITLFILSKQPIKCGIILIIYLVQLIYTYFMWKRCGDNK